MLKEYLRHCPQCQLTHKEAYALRINATSAPTTRAVPSDSHGTFFLALVESRDGSDNVTTITNRLGKRVGLIAGRAIFATQG